MGCSSSKEQELSDVDARLQRSQKEAAFNFKFLLLGAGEAGKSTFVKQAKFVFQVRTSNLLGLFDLYNVLRGMFLKQKNIYTPEQFGKTFLSA